MSPADLVEKACTVVRLRLVIGEVRVIVATNKNLPQLIRRIWQASCQLD